MAVIFVYERIDGSLFLYLCFWRRRTTTAGIVLQTATLQRLTSTKYHFTTTMLSSLLRTVARRMALPTMGDVHTLDVHEYIYSMELMNGCA